MCGGISRELNKVVTAAYRNDERGLIRTSWVAALRNDAGMGFAGQMGWR